MYIFYHKLQRRIKKIELESSTGVNFHVRELMNSRNIGNFVCGVFERAERGNLAAGYVCAPPIATY